MLFGAAFGAKVGNAPAEVNDREPEALREGRIFADPSLEISEGSLPVLPDDAAGFDGASVGAKIVGVERFENEGDFARGFFEVVEDEFGVFGEVEFFVEVAGFGEFGAKKFVGDGVEAAVEREELEDVSGF